MFSNTPLLVSWLITGRHVCQTSHSLNNLLLWKQRIICQQIAVFFFNHSHPVLHESCDLNPRFHSYKYKSLLLHQHSRESLPIFDWLYFLTQRGSCLQTFLRLFPKFCHFYPAGCIYIETVPGQDLSTDNWIPTQISSIISASETFVQTQTTDQSVWADTSLASPPHASCVW